MDALDDKQVAILVHNYFEQIEYTSPRQALEEEGATVHLVSTGEKAVTGMNGPHVADTFDVDVVIDEMKTNAYHALVIPGGVVNSDKLRMEEPARDWVRSFNDSGKPLAVICHGPWLLVSAGLVKNRQLTSYYTLEDDIKNAGGNWAYEPLVVDGNLITSRNPDDLEQFNAALIEKMSTSGN